MLSYATPRRSMGAPMTAIFNLILLRSLKLRILTSYLCRITSCGFNIRLPPLLQDIASKAGL